MDPIAGFITAGLLLILGAYFVATRWVKQLPTLDIVRKKKDMFTVIGVVLIGIGLMNGGWNEVTGWAGTATASVASAVSSTSEPQNAASDMCTNCPSTGKTAVTIDVQNPLNTSGTEEFDVTMKCIGENNVVSITDTTDPSSSDFVCGDEYTCYITSTSGAEGDSSKVSNILTGAGEITAQGDYKFVACTAGQAAQLEVEQHGVPEIRAWDVSNAGWMYPTTDSSGAGEYNSTDGIIFGDTTDGSAIAVGTGGEVHIKYYIRSTTIDENLNDRGIILLVESATTSYQEPTVYANGQKLTNVMEQLTEDEKLAYSSYEYAYLIDTDIMKNDEAVIDIQQFALGGVNPTIDIEYDFAFRGQYASTTNANAFKTGAVKDDASHTQVHTLFDTSVDLS